MGTLGENQSVPPGAGMPWGGAWARSRQVMKVPPPPGYTLLKQSRAAPTQNEGGTPLHVSIRIKGHLDPGWQEWLEGLQIVHEPDGTSRLSGTLPDQPALHGVLTKISHLSLMLLSLESRETTPDEGR